MSDLVHRAERFKADVSRVLSGSAAMFLSADVKTLLVEQADLLLAIAQRMNDGTPADSGGNQERK